MRWVSTNGAAAGVETGNLEDTGNATLMPTDNCCAMLGTVALLALYVWRCCLHGLLEQQQGTLPVCCRLHDGRR
jgi:hypothetical protein